MKTNQTGQTNLIDGGKENWEKTNEFKSKVAEIKKELEDKYSLTLLNERNWLRRLLIQVRFMVEMRKRIEQISSFKNLHMVNH
jgi:hypothetical protein